MANFVRSITLIEKSPDNRVQVETIYRKKQKRKQSRWAKPLEKSQRRSLKASKVFVNELLDRHNKSSNKRKDGWLRDSGKNYIRAARKSYKKIT